VGILVCRNFSDKQRFLDRCRNAANDGQGFPLVLDDDDLEAMVAEIEALDFPNAPERREFQVLRKQFDRLVGLA